MGKITVGTRKSKLALIQTNWVIDQLKNAGVHYDFEIREFLTAGDQNLNVSLSEIGGSGIFIQELEQAMLDGHVDIAVHSLKDVPHTIPEGLMIAATPVREDHRDAYIAKNHIKLKDLPAGAVIGTSSLRRSAQILAMRPDVKTTWIRGTVGSRIQQLHGDKYDAIILAVAGIRRLGISEDIITEYLPTESFVPAAGQGALAIECRRDDEFIREILTNINDPETEKSILAERLLVQKLDETDKAPIGSYAYVHNGEIQLQVAVISEDGKNVIYESGSGKEPETVANKVAEKLIKQGANAIIEQFQDGLKE